MKNRFKRIFESNLLLILFISGDVAFVIIHIVYTFSPKLYRNPLYSLYMDRGYSEIFQYLKYYWLIIIFGIIWCRTRKLFYFSWMLVFTYLLCDDSLQIHENVGQSLVEYWGFSSAFGLRAQDFGEILTSGLFGIPIILLLFYSYVYGSEKIKIMGRDLSVLLGLLVFFGIFIDMLSILVEGNRYIGAITGVIEDGGEMAVMSLICAYSARIYYNKK